MTPLLAFDMLDAVPIVVFAAIVAGAWFLMAALSRRTSRAEERLGRLGRPQSAKLSDRVGSLNSDYVQATRRACLSCRPPLGPVRTPVRRRS